VTPSLGSPIGNIYCGTCSWTDPTLLRSGFYPASVHSAEDRLRFYAAQFPLVEVDSTFYALSSRENAERWVERTPDAFRFNIKAFGLLTEHGVAADRLPPDIRELLPKSAREKDRIYLSAVPPEARERVWAAQIEALEPVVSAGKLGCVLFQFGHWFRANKVNRDYLEGIADRAPWPVAVEFRGGGWMEAGRRRVTLDLLERLGFAYVIVDEPQGFRSSTPPVLATTARLALVRFHGRNRKTWEAKDLTAAQRFDYLYSEEELREWVDPTRRLAREVESVHVLFNNCHRDYGVRNARQMADLWSEK
jgi:uncharacterized protein YecE (DUF72 family)